MLQGTTIEPVARWLGVTSDEPARMPSVVEVGAVRELGGDVVEHVIREGDAAAGARLRDLGLPRDALVSLIVRGDEVLLPARLDAAGGGRPHARARPPRGGGRAAGDPRPLAQGPGHAPGPAAAHLHRQRPDLHARGRGARRTATPRIRRPSRGVEVVEHVRTRRDVPGALVVLEDGRYAVTGPILMIGPPGQMQTQARRRMARTDDDAEISWWQEVIGACAL